MFDHQLKSATLAELQAWLDQIERKELGLRWDDYESQRSWAKHRKRAERLIAAKEA